MVFKKRRKGKKKGSFKKSYKKAKTFAIGKLNNVKNLEWVQLDSAAYGAFRGDIMQKTAFADNWPVLNQVPMQYRDNAKAALGVAAVALVTPKFNKTLNRVITIETAQAASDLKQDFMPATKNKSSTGYIYG